MRLFIELEDLDYRVAEDRYIIKGLACRYLTDEQRSYSPPGGQMMSIMNIRWHKKMLELLIEGAP